MAEDGGVVEVPEEGVVGVAADDGGQAWVGDVSEAEVGGISEDALEEVVDLAATDTYTLDELLDEEEAVEVFICSETGLLGEWGERLGDGKMAYVDEIGDQEVFCTGTA